MRKHLWVAGIAAAALIPSFAMAQTSCEQQQQNRRNTGTVVGGLAGAVVGNQVAGRGDRTAGTVIGAVVGAVAGNQIAKATGTDCARAYGYYDDDGRWHANAVAPTRAEGYYDREGRWIAGAPQGYAGNDGYWVAASSGEGYYDSQGRWMQASNSQPSQGDMRRADAYGYYDRDGMWHAGTAGRGAATGYYDRNNVWVSGAPNGYYDTNGRWVSAGTTTQAAGYYDSNGRWVPASASGYFASDGQWVSGTATGYYDRRGRWVAGPVTGSYDSRGRWVSGQASGHRDARGVWVPDAQPGYYDTNGRWRAGQVMGYYDARGRWIPTTGAMPAPSTRMWNGDDADTRGREAWIADRIREEAARGTMSRQRSRQALATLSSIRQEDTSMRRRDGQLNRRSLSYIQDRLDALTSTLRLDGPSPPDRDRRGQ